MKKLLFILLAVVFCLNAGAQIFNFQNLASMNLQRGAITTATDTNGWYIYVSNGFSPTKAYTTQIERYDASGNTWSVYANSLIAKRYASSALLGGGNNLYLFNGIDSTGAVNSKMEVVNLSTGTVTFSTTNPLPTYYSGSAVWDSLIYVFGGSTSSTTYTNKLYSFNTSTQVWTSLANMPEAKQASGAIINGKLYVLGGYKGTNSNRIDMYDISTNTWTNLGFMSDSISSYAIAVNGSTIYMVGDYSNLVHLASYNVATNTYSVLSETNMIGRRNAGASVINNSLYIMGGNQTSSTSSSLNSLQITSLPTAGISQISGLNTQISIYPNPNNGTFVIQTNATTKQTMQVYDVNGKMVLSQSLPPALSGVSIDAGSLSEGVYNICISNNEGVINKRLVIVK